MAAKPQGVVETRGMCDERPGALETPDKAYKVTKEAVLTIPTANLFPSECRKGAPSLLSKFPVIGKLTSFATISN